MDFELLTGLFRRPSMVIGAPEVESDPKNVETRK